MQLIHEIRSYFDVASLIIESLGILAIVVGGTIAVLNFVRALRTTRFLDAYQEFRRSLARAILIGLEFLIAGDIIGTVVVSPTLSNVAVLMAIVAVRTFISMTITVEVEGRWPWQKPTVTSESTRG
jgi:uncharacterized membrane protein